VITAANQTVRVNKYFANNFTVNRGDGSSVVTLTTTGATKTYTSPGTYFIRLQPSGATGWTFQQQNSHPLVPKS